MQSLMMITCSNKTAKRILTVVFTVCLALVIAFCPIATTIGYANVVNQCFEVVGFIVGSVGGGFATKACLAAAGITTTAAFTSVVQAFVILLAAMGVGIAVSSIIHILTSEESLDSFGVVFWETLKNCWDSTVMKFKCSAAMFSVLVQKVKSYFGIGVENHNDYYTDFPFKNSKTPVDVDYYKTNYPATIETYHFSSNGIDKIHQHCVINNDEDFLLHNCKGCSNSLCGYRESSFNSCTVDPLCDFDLLEKTVTITMRNTGNTISFYNKYDDYSCCFIPLPVVYNKGLYFSYLTCLNTGSFLCSINSNLRYNGYKLQCDTSSNTCYYNDGTSNTYLYFLFSDGVIEPASSVEEFLYNLFISGGSVVQCKTALTSVSTTDDITDEINKKLTVAGSVDGVIPKDADATTVKPKSKDVTYDKTKDVTKTVVGKLTGYNVKSGDVVIDGTAVKGLDITDSLDIADAVSITNVAAEDVVIEDTATGTDVSLPADGFVDWVLGVNLIKSASSGITEKFPFCIPTYLKSQLNILVADEKEPIFKIPFKIKSANIGGDIEIDLTRFDSLIKITDFFLLAILVVGLAFSTKKMFF